VRWRRRLATAAAVAVAVVAAGDPVGRHEVVGDEVVRDEVVRDEVVRDAFTATAHEVTELRRAGMVPVCQVRVAVWEPGRPDAARFPARVRAGATGAGDGEQWLDVRAWDTLAPVISDRLRLCREKGFAVADLGREWGDPAGAGLTAADWDRFGGWVLAVAEWHGLEVRRLGASAA
jgi:hypothetical protein